MLKKILDKVLNEQEINNDEAVSLINVDLEELKKAANQIREHFCGNEFDLCSIINGKSGKCKEDCKFCGQSIHYHTNIQTYDLLSNDEIKKMALYNEKKGVQRFSIVTSGRCLNNQEFENILKIYQELNQSTNISLCASLGLLKYHQLKKLKDVKVIKYHNNLETSQKYFKEICTTHTYQQKIETINEASNAGLQICSGGIVGMNETWQDRIDLAFKLNQLKIMSIPINILNPIKNTPLEKIKPLSKEEIERIFAIFRFINPKAIIKIAGGRELLSDKGLGVFKSGANGAITGDMLTTKGISIDDDIKMINELGFEIKKI